MPRPPRPSPAGARPARRGAGRVQERAPEQAAPQRIAKLLARAGVGSRRDVERMIGEGRVAVGGEVLTTPATLLRDLAGVTVDGRPVARPERTRLFRFHKPPGVLTTARDPRGRPTLFGLLPPGLGRLLAVGRLDMTSEGLILLTNDGGLKRALELPATGLERRYRVRAYGPATQERLDTLVEGVEIEGVRYGRIVATLERKRGDNSWIEVTLTEGKNREVRRVLEWLGLKVNRLIRVGYGPFALGELAVAHFEEVVAHEVDKLERALLG